MKLYLVLFIFFIFNFLQCFELSKEIYNISKCDWFNSKMMFLILNEIKFYYKNTLDLKRKDCKLQMFDSNLFDKFYGLEANAQNSYTNKKCTECGKAFKNKDLLFKHFLIFHERNSECFADYCNVFNCERYRNFFADNKEYLTQDKDWNLSIFSDRAITCDNTAKYRKICGTLLDNCLISTLSTEIQNKIKFDFYESFCSKINCNDKFEKLDVPNNTSFSILKMIIGYIIFIFMFVFVLVLWLSKII